MEKTDKANAISLLEMMLRIRHFELAVEKNFQLGHVYGTAHLAIGQEATATGAICALNDCDVISSTHRGHGHCIAKGADLNLMMAEIFGRATGYCKGKGGSMHIADISRGNLGANGIVGGSLGIATGAALAVKKLKTDQVVMCFFGDGATNQGIFHEAVNMASIWNLPIIYFCENNQYGMGMPIKKATNLKKLSDRAKGYNIPGDTIDGNDVMIIYDKVKEVVNQVRSGAGPYFLEAITYRIRGHSLRDAQRYRAKGESKKWLDDYDPIERFKKYLLAENILNQEKINEIENNVLRSIDEAVKFALESPLPDPSSVTDDVYA